MNKILIDLKRYAELSSDLSTKTFLYKKLCDEISSEKNNIFDILKTDLDNLKDKKEKTQFEEGQLYVLKLIEKYL